MFSSLRILTVCIHMFALDDALARIVSSVLCMYITLTWTSLHWNYWVLNQAIFKLQAKHLRRRTYLSTFLHISDVMV